MSKQDFDRKLALGITNHVTMNTAYLFTFISLFSLPAVLTLVDPSLKSFFPSWLVSASLVALVAWISSNFLQLVLLPIIMVGQSIQAEQTIKHVSKKTDELKKHVTKTHKG